MQSIVYYAINRERKTACLVPAESWEELQCRAVFGIVMPDNRMATGIGRCKSGEFEKRAQKSGIKILSI